MTIPTDLKKLPEGIRNRSGNWHWRFRAGGTEYSDTTGLRATARNLPRALSILEEARQKVKRGQAADLRLQAKPFTEAVAQFLAWARGEKEKQTTVDRLADSFASQMEFWKKTPLHTLSAGDVEAYKTWRRENQIKEVTLANDFNALSQLFRFGRKSHWCLMNPCDEVDPPSRQGARRMFILSPADEQTYFAAAREASQDLFDLGRLMIQQGCRPSEFTELEWPSVNLITGEFSIMQGKTPAAIRKLLLTPESRSILARRYQARDEAIAAKTELLARWWRRNFNKVQGEILVRLRRQIEDLKRWVFPAGKGTGHLKTYQRAHQRAREAADLAFVVYDLRHTFATRMANGDERNGWQPYAALPVLKDIMGHEKIEVTMIYVKRSPEAMRMAMERYGEAAAQEVAA
jgi:integrase